MIAGRTSTVRRKLFFVITPILVVTVAVCAFGVGRAARHVVRPAFERSSMALLQSLVSNLDSNPRDTKGIMEFLDAFLSSPGHDGFVLARSGYPLLVVGTVEAPQELIDHINDAIGAGPGFAEVSGFGPIHARVVAGYRCGSNDLLAYEYTLHGLSTPFTTAGIVVAASVVCIGLLIAYVLASTINKPLVARLEVLENALIKYGRGETSIRLPSDQAAPDEFDQVNGAFNHMAQRIKELEDERASQREKERRLLADLAHDVNTPITVLRGYAETLVEQRQELDDETRESICAELLGQSLYVQAIVEDLLTMASAASSELRIRPVEFELDGIFDNIVDSFQPMALQRGATILGDAEGLRIIADPVRLRQILTNLVRNSLLHASGATLIEIGAARDAGGVLIWVRDDGPGVAPEVIPRLFERYGRGEGSGSGWGLGLAIVRTLAELHGGTVCHHALNSGARFEVFFPQED